MTASSLLFGVPTTYQRLLEYKAIEWPQCAAARAPARPATSPARRSTSTLKAMIEHEFGLPLLNGYGITECAPGISGVRAEAPRTDCSVGTILPGIEVRLVGRDGNAVAPTARSASCMCAVPT